MAEIRVERKRGSGNWMWLLVLLVLVVAVAVYLWQAGYINLGAVTENAQRRLTAVGEDSWRAMMIV